LTFASPPITDRPIGRRTVVDDGATRVATIREQTTKCELKSD